MVPVHRQEWYSCRRVRGLHGVMLLTGAASHFVQYSSHPYTLQPPSVVLFVPTTLKTNSDAQSIFTLLICSNEHSFPLKGSSVIPGDTSGVLGEVMSTRELLIERSFLVHITDCLRALYHSHFVRTTSLQKIWMWKEMRHIFSFRCIE